MADKKKKKTEGKTTSGNKKTEKPANKPKTSKIKAKSDKSNKVPKNTGKLKKTAQKPLKHDDNYEKGTGGFDKIIVVGKKGQKKAVKAREKELKRVAKQGGFTAWDARTGKTFATEKEAYDYAADILKRTGKVIEVTRTNRQVSHTFKAASKTDK